MSKVQKQKLKYTAPGFGPLDISDISINNKIINVDFHNAINSVIITRSINGASTLALNLTDPKREILRSKNFFKNGDTIEIPDGNGHYLQFVFMQVNKASDQIQVTFESIQVNRLRTIYGTINSSSITDAGAFVQSICQAHNIHFIGPVNDPRIQPTVYAVSSGTGANPYEDAWTSFQRIAGSLGWRCWESAGVIFFGPDDYWFNQIDKAPTPPVNSWFKHGTPTLKEFHEDVMLIDYDWNMGAPFGDLTITCMVDYWQYNPGEIVKVSGVGPADGYWLISAMQRDFFNAQATVTATVPMPQIYAVNPPVLPLLAGRPNYTEAQLNQYRQEVINLANAQGTTPVL